MFHHCHHKHNRSDKLPSEVFPAIWYRKIIKINSKRGNWVMSFCWHLGKTRTTNYWAEILWNEFERLVTGELSGKTDVVIMSVTLVHIWIRERQRGVGWKIEGKTCYGTPPHKRFGGFHTYDTFPAALGDAPCQGGTSAEWSSHERILHVKSILQQMLWKCPDIFKGTLDFRGGTNRVFGQQCFCPLSNRGRFDENGENDEFAFYPLKTRVSFLRPTKTTKMAGATQFRKRRVCSSLI